MRIAQVDLENVKSYVRASATFMSGINAICGDNGAGKSTLLEAIGFALFDFLAVAQDDFVREGEKTATVTVHVDGNDGRAYQIVRRCGSTSQYYVYDPEIEQKLTDGKQETMVWINDFLGMDGADDVTVLFRDAVGVPQGLLTAAFLERPGRRKDIFNPLLRVDEYETVWQALRDPARRLEQLIHEQATTIAGFEAQVAGLPALQTRANELSQAIAEDEATETETTAELETVTLELGVLQARKEKLEALEKEVDRARAATQTVKTQLESAEAAVAASKAALAVIEATSADHEAYMAAGKALVALEDERTKRDQLQAKYHRMEQNLAVNNEQVTQLEARWEQIAAAQTAMTELEPDVARQTELECALTKARRAADHLEMAERSLDTERTRLLDLQARLREAEAGVALRAEKEEVLDAARDDLTQVNERFEALTERSMALSREQAEMKAQADAASERLAAAQRTLARAEERRASLASQRTELTEKLQELDEVQADVVEHRAMINGLTAQQQTLTVEVAAREAELAQVTTNIEVLSSSDEPRCPVCGERMTVEHRRELLEAYDEKRRALNTAHSEAQVTLEEVQAALERARSQLTALTARVQAMPRPEEADRLSAQMAEQEAAIAQVEAEIVKEQSRRDDLQQKATEVSERLAALQAEREAAQAARGDRQASVEALEAEVAPLPRPADVEDLTARVEAQVKTVIDAEAASAELAGAREQVIEFSEALEVLGDPRHDYDRAADVAAQADAVETKLATTRKRVEALDEELAYLTEALEAYAELNERLEAQRAAQAEHEPGHRRYLQHELEAGALDARRQTVAKLEGDLEVAQTALAEQVAARDTAAAGYDLSRHADLAERVTELRTTLASVQERLRQQRTLLTEAQAEIARLEEVQKALDAAEAERTELEETQELLGFLRQVLRDAGPEVTRAMVEIISLQAERLYADIMQSYRSRLRWTPDYDVILRTGGRERTFSQLSGGEQMSAALAVRLALLRETSTIDVAFFDEPTANLDSDRRSNLAEQIVNIKGFSQLFVISHDDTFEQDTDHVVRIRKENGESYIEDAGSDHVPS